MRGLLRILERTRARWYEYAAYFICITLARGILEGLLERDHLLGIRAVPGVSQAMLFAHFPAFFLAAFLIVVLVLALLSGRGPSRVIPLVLRFWPIILTPPLIDAAISGGSGYAMTYIFTPEQVVQAVKEFWKPTLEPIGGITPGMRIEIVLLCLGATVYVAVWKGIVRGLGAAALIFAGLLSLGSMPVLWGIGEQGQGWIMSGGFGNLQSHRMTLVNLQVSLLLALLIWRLHSRATFAAFLSCFRWLRSIMYACLTALGVSLVYVLEEPWLNTAFQRPGDWLSLAGVLIAEILCFQAAGLSNDLADEPWDDASSKKRFLLSPGVGRDAAKILSLVLAASGLLFALCVQYAVFLLVLVQLGMAWAYSHPPLRLKRFPLISTAIIAGAAALAVEVGGAMIAREWVFSVLPVRIFFGLWISFFLGFGVKDIPDVESDRAGGVRTLPVMLGKRKAVFVLAGGVFTGFLLFALISGMRVLIGPAVILGALSAFAIAADRTWSERLIFIFFLGGIVAIGVMAFLDKDWAAAERTRIPERCVGVSEQGFQPATALRRFTSCDLTSAERGEALKQAWPLAGVYPWLIPEAPLVLEPDTALALLAEAANSGVCTGIALAASLELLARRRETEEWVGALEGSLAWGQESAVLLAVSARQADELGLGKRARALLERGRLKWPRESAVWAEKARFLLRRQDFRGALTAARKALALDPASRELLMDIQRLERMAKAQDSMTNRAERANPDF